MVATNPGNWRHLGRVPSPEAGIHRVERAKVHPFSPVDWAYAHGADGTFNGRFDDPRTRSQAKDDERFRVVYAATTAMGAFGETIAHMRGIPGAQRRLNAIVDDFAPDSIGGVSTFKAASVVSRDWRADRQIRTTVLARHLRFADLWDAASLNYLREAMAPLLLALGLSDLDLGAMSGATPESRQFTRACARHVYDLTDQQGRPAFAGIRYRSRGGDQWECWAVYSDRLVHALGSSPSSCGISESEPGLMAAAQVFGLRIEPDHPAP